MAVCLKILEHFRFSPVWVNWVQQCISTSSLSIIIIGSPFGKFQPSWGLHQGYPLSPYLFILCSEVLSRLLLSEEHKGHLKGIQLGRTAPCITHLLFADDLLLFAKASIYKAATLNDCFDKYMAWSRQKVNT